MKAKILFYYVEELASNICGLNDDADIYEIDNALMQKFKISFNHFQNLCEHLLPLIVEKGINVKLYKGFVIDNKDLELIRVIINIGFEKMK